MATFVTDNQVLTALAEALHKDPADLQPFWAQLDGGGNVISGIVVQQHAAAYAEIVERLMRRGYTPAQIAGWDRGAEFELQVSVYYCIAHGGQADPPQYDKTMLDILGKGYLEKLDWLLLVINGVWATPADTPGNIAFAPLETSLDLFGQVVDPRDARIGEVVRW